LAIKTDAGLVEIAVRERGFPAAVITVITGRGLILWIQATGYNAQLRPRFKYPEAGNLQIKILFVGGLYQRVEDRVIEHLPPLSVVYGLPGNALVFTI
jgi:hypothetical protein